MILLRRLRGELPLPLRGARARRELFAELVRIAAPAVVMQAMASVTSLGLNAILKLWSETAVWVLGAYFKLQTFVFMPIFSVSSALVSIVSYNYGAGWGGRVSGSVRFSLKLALAIALAGGAGLWLGASPLLKLCFRAGEEAMAIGPDGTEDDGPGLPPGGGEHHLLRRFQSLGYSRYSLAVSALRYGLLTLPAAPGAGDVGPTVVLPVLSAGGGGDHAGGGGPLFPGEPGENTRHPDKDRDNVKKRFRIPAEPLFLNAYIIFTV